MSEIPHRCTVETADRLLAADNLIARGSGEDKEEEEEDDEPEKEESDEEEYDGYSE
jgi:hypothetical protein